MPQSRALKSEALWERIETTEQDWDLAEPQLLTNMFSQLVVIRTFEEYVLELAAEGLVHGPAHSSIGQEGGAVGSVLALKDGDTINGSHRGHHQFLAKVLAHVEPKGIDPAKDFSDEIRAELLRTLAEICGLDRGYSHGRGGSMHLRWMEAGRPRRRHHRSAGWDERDRGRLGLGPSSSGDRCRRGHLLRRRCHQHRFDSRVPQFGIGVAPSDMFLRREQSLCSVHDGGRVDGRAPPLWTRARIWDR